MIADWLWNNSALLQISLMDFTADEFIFLFSSSRQDLLGPTFSTCVCKLGWWSLRQMSSFLFSPAQDKTCLDLLVQLACQRQDRDPSKPQCASSRWCVYLPPDKWRRIMRAVAGAPRGKKGEVRLAIMWTPSKGRSTYVTLRRKSVTSCAY